MATRLFPELKSTRNYLHNSSLPCRVILSSRFDFSESGTAHEASRQLDRVNRAISVHVQIFDNLHHTDTGKAFERLRQAFHQLSPMK